MEMIEAYEQAVLEKAALKQQQATLMQIIGWLLGNVENGHELIPPEELGKYSVSIESTEEGIEVALV
jgi:hypothetical protein